MRRGGADAHRIAIRECSHGAADPERASSPADVLDHDRLSECLAQALAEEPGEYVSRSAGRKRHDDGNWARRVALRGRGSEKSEDAGENGQGTEKPGSSQSKDQQRFD